MTTKTNLKVCHDCGAEEGQLHEFGCDMETCPFCGNQLISCECCYNILKIDASEGSWAYSHGLTESQDKQWECILEGKGRIPYVRVPFLCAMCGEVYPEMFNVPDEEWGKYIIPELQSEVLCWKCYDNMITLFPTGWKKNGTGG
ncbi:hypothetical protein LCGC14_1064560 [marine sediment metagenome]|uniref:Uncharacterized protein n=1 Tax=marine sediment metagenome TaxID=412755 RepID=A0A0F9QR16_9ZZZZ